MSHHWVPSRPLSALKTIGFHVANLLEIAFLQEDTPRDRDHEKHAALTETLLLFNGNI